MPSARPRSSCARLVLRRCNGSRLRSSPRVVGQAVSCLRKCRGVEVGDANPPRAPGPVQATTRYTVALFRSASLATRTRGLLTSRSARRMRSSARLVLIGHVSGLSGVACLEPFVCITLHLLVGRTSLEPLVYTTVYLLLGLLLGAACCAVAWKAIALPATTIIARVAVRIRVPPVRCSGPVTRELPNISYLRLPFSTVPAVRNRIIPSLLAHGF